MKAFREILKWSGFKIVKTIERGGTKKHPELTERICGTARKQCTNYCKVLKSQYSRKKNINCKRTVSGAVAYGRRNQGIALRHTLSGIGGRQRRSDTTSQQCSICAL